MKANQVYRWMQWRKKSIIMMINLVLLKISWIPKVQIHSWNRIILIGESRVIPVKDHEWQQSSLQIMLIRLSVLIITTTISNHHSKSSNKKEKLEALVVKRTWHLVMDLLSLPQNLKTLSSQKTTLTNLQTEHQVDKEEGVYTVKKIDQQISTTNGKNLK